MDSRILGQFTSIEARRAHARHAELPSCDALRACAGLIATAQALMTTRLSERIDLRLLIQAGFVLSGLLLTRFLLRAREPVVEGPNGIVSFWYGSWARSFVQAIPVGYVVLVVAGVLFVPQLLSLESIPTPDLNEIPTWIVKTLASWFTEFRSDSIRGRSLVAWPLVLLLAPRRLLGLVFLFVLGSGLVLQFTALLSGEIRPASILVNPSALDLLSGGALIGSMIPASGNSESGPLGRWAVLMGVVVALASLSFCYQKGLPNWGTVAILSAPAGFGAINFILEIIGTTLAASLSWRDLGEMMEGLKRSPAP
jgi:hypothetical protein